MSDQNGANEGSATATAASTQGDPKPTGAKDESGNRGQGAQSSATGGGLAGFGKAMAATRSEPPSAFPQTSRQLAGVGRVLHAYSPAWDGPRPAIVVNAWCTPEGLQRGDKQLVNANVMFDGVNEPKVLECVRLSGIGNTFTSREVHDALTPEQRRVVTPTLRSPGDFRASWNGRDTPPVHFEWPPRT